METPTSFDEVQQQLVLHHSAVVTSSAASARPIYSEKETLRFLQSTLDALTSHVAVLDGDGMIVATNRAWRRSMDANHGNASACGVGANYLTVCDGAFGEFSQEAISVAQGIREVMVGRRPEFSLEYPCHSPVEPRWCILQVTPFEGEGPFRAVVTHEDITKRKLAEQTLRASEENYRRIVETAIEGIWTLDSEFHTSYVNNQMASMMGYHEEEMLGLSPLTFVFAEDFAWMQAKLQGCLYGFHIKFDGRYRRKDGTELWLMANTRPIWEEGNFVGAFGMYTDITLRKQAEEAQKTLVQALEVERTRLADLFVQAPAFIAVLRGPQHIFERFNQPYLQLVGHRELVGRPVREAFPEIEGQGFFELLDEVYRTGEPFIGKDIPIYFQVTPTAPVEERYIDFVYQPLVEADGSVSGIFVHGVDRTARKRAEEASREHQQRIEALNTRLKRAATETHHRVKNNLKLVTAFIDTLKRSGTEQVPMSDLVRLSQNVKALDIIHDVLMKEARGDGDARRISAKRAFDLFLPLLEPALGARPLRTDIEKVFLSANQITSLTLIANELISNAIQYSAGDIKLTLRTAGEIAILEVSDEGPGFAEGFDPKRAAHKGLELIEKLSRHELQGATSYRNRQQGGARVTVMFPLHRSMI